MKVINICGFDFKFDRGGRTYRIPADGMLHVIPDECYYTDNFQGMLRVIVAPLPIKRMASRMDRKVVDINDPTIKEIIIERVVNEEEKKNSKPLSGVRLKDATRTKLKRTNNAGRKKKVVVQLEATEETPKMTITTYPDVTETVQ